MRNPQDIEIQKLAVHILNNHVDPPDITISEEESEVAPEINDFFASHIRNSLADENAKIAKFSRGRGAARELCREALANNRRFLRNSRNLAELLFAPMRQTRAISAGDMVVCLYTASNLVGPFLGIFKMDLSEAFAHDIQRHNGRVKISIRPQDNVLPSPKQRLQKCAFIRPRSRDYDLVILDNQIAHLSDSPGVANFFSRTFLDCELWQTDQEKTRLFRRLTTKWVDEHYEELGAGQAQTLYDGARQAILSESVNVRDFGSVLIPDRRLREDYESYLNQGGLRDVQFVPDKAYAEHATRKRKFRADGDILVTGDADRFDDLVTVNTIRDAQNRITVTIRTTRWTEQTR